MEILIGILIAIPIGILIQYSRKKNSLFSSKKNSSKKTIKAGSDYEKIKKRVIFLQKRISVLKNNIKNLNIKVTDLKRINSELQKEKLGLEKQLEKIDVLKRKKEELFTMYIHNVKNPASAISNLTELLDSYEITFEEQNQIIQSILIASDRIIKISNEISTAITSEIFKDELKLETISINEIIDEIFQNNLLKARKKGIEIIKKAPSDLPLMEIDKQKVTEIIDNLLDNAIKYSPKNKSIEFLISRDESSVIFEISDEGPGISDEEIKYVFRKGVKSTSKPTNGERSYGLGLWIVKKLVEEHKGRVWVKTKLGLGSVFAFSLPITQS